MISSPYKTAPPGVDAGAATGAPSVQGQMEEMLNSAFDYPAIEELDPSLGMTYSEQAWVCL